MQRRHLMALAALGSFGLLAGAFAFQHIGGFRPLRDVPSANAGRTTVAVEPNRCGGALPAPHCLQGGCLGGRRERVRLLTVRPGLAKQTSHTGVEPRLVGPDEPSLHGAASDMGAMDVRRCSIPPGDGLSMTVHRCGVVRLAPWVSAWLIMEGITQPWLLMRAKAAGLWAGRRRAARAPQ